MKVRLLQFFRDGHFHTVLPGFPRHKVEEVLGKPYHFNPYSEEAEYSTAPIWYYGNVQFYFNDKNEKDPDILSGIGFKGQDLQDYDPSDEDLEVDLWIFANGITPDIQTLKGALLTENIEFVDTGLESIIYNKALGKSQVVPYNPQAEDSFGTLVLSNGIQVRYDETFKILSGQIGGDWFYKGREQHISW